MPWPPSNQSRRRFLGLARRAAAAIAVPTAVSARAQNAPAAGVRGGTLTMLVDPEPTTLVALTNSADPTMLVSAKVTEGLLAYGFDLEPRPQLATQWAASEDGRRFVFRLRERVRWHDGMPFTSADVAFSIDALKRFHPRGRSTFSNVVEVRTPDPQTAIIELSAPAPFLLRAFAACESPMVPRHVYEASDIAANRNGTAPVGFWHAYAHAREAAFFAIRIPAGISTDTDRVAEG